MEIGDTFRNFRDYVPEKSCKRSATALIIYVVEKKTSDWNNSLTRPGPALYYGKIDFTMIIWRE